MKKGENMNKEKIIEEYIVKNNGSESITVEIECQKEFVAPVEANKVIGHYKVKLEDETIESGNIYIGKEIPRKDITYYLKEMIKNYSTYIEKALLL